MKLFAKLLYGLAVAVFALGILPILALFLFAGWVSSKLFDSRRCDVICCPYCKHDS